MTDFEDRFRCEELLKGGDENVREINKLCDEGDRFEVFCYPSPLDRSNVDLQGARFNRGRLTKCHFQKANLSGVEFFRSSLDELDFEEADLSRSKLVNSELRESNFDKANLTDSDLSEADVRDCSFSDTDLTNARLCSAEFLRCEFARVAFAGANLAAAEFSNCEFTENNFRNANLAGASLVRVDLAGQDLSGANLQEADLLEANLTGADLTGANLANAKLDKASLVDARLDDAVFESARMKKTRLSPGQEKHLTDAGQIANVEILDEDRLPGLDHSQEITFKLYHQTGLASTETKFSDGMHSYHETTAPMQVDQLKVHPRRGVKKHLETRGACWGSADVELTQNEFHGVPLKGFLEPIPNPYRNALRRAARMRILIAAPFTLAATLVLSMLVLGAIENFFGATAPDQEFWPYLLALNIVPLLLLPLVDYMIRSRHPAKRFSIDDKSPAKGEVLVLVESSLFDEGTLPADAKSIWLITGMKTTDGSVFYNPTETTKSTYTGEKTITVNYSSKMDEKLIHDSIRNAAGRSVILADGWELTKIS